MKTKSSKPKDYGVLIVVSIVLGGCALFLLGVAIEILKLFALVKWVFT